MFFNNYKSLNNREKEYKLKIGNMSFPGNNVLYFTDYRKKCIYKV